MRRTHKAGITWNRAAVSYNAEAAALIKKCIQCALELMGVDMPCEVAVTVTNDDEIQALNLKHRGIDKPTDVLSFPMLALAAGDSIHDNFEQGDMLDGRVFLGDIVLSFERAIEQAVEYGHTAARECGFLTVHSVLHLLGYDHEAGDEQEREMRSREESILASLQLER